MLTFKDFGHNPSLLPLPIRPNIAAILGNPGHVVIPQEENIVMVSRAIYKNKGPDIPTTG